MTLRDLRERRHLTQEQLARLSGLKQTHISQIERGRVRDPQRSTLQALAKGLNTSMEAVARAIAKTPAAA